MRFIKRLLVGLFLLAVLTFGVFFAIQNGEQAPLDLLILQLPALPISLWVFLAFALGGVVGMGISALALVRLKSQGLLLQRQLDRREQELNALRTSDLRPANNKA